MGGRFPQITSHVALVAFYSQLSQLRIQPRLGDCATVAPPNADGATGSPPYMYCTSNHKIVLRVTFSKRDFKLKSTIIMDMVDLSLKSHLGKLVHS